MATFGFVRSAFDDLEKTDRIAGALSNEKPSAIFKLSGIKDTLYKQSRAETWGEMSTSDGVVAQVN